MVFWNEPHALNFSELIMFCGAAGEAEEKETDLAEELPLCCCRMETPSSGGSFSTRSQTCMAMESSDGMVTIKHIN